MACSIIKAQSVQIDVMVLEKYWPKLAGIFQRTGCRYEKEDRTRIRGDKTYIILRDVQADKANCLGEAVGMFFGLEWYFLTDESPRGRAKDNFYILMRPRRKGKKNVQKDRQEAGARCEGGDAGEPGTVQPGEDFGCDAGGAEPCDAGADAVCEQPVPGAEADSHDHDDQ